MRIEQKLAGQGLEAGVARELTGVLVCRDWEADVIANTSIHATEPTPLDAGRPDLTASGKMSYRLRWAYRADASPRFSVEIAGGVTRVTITGEGGRPSVVSSASWEVERHWRRLLYAGIVADQSDWWTVPVNGREEEEPT